ncbi:MAG: hypothetical protein JW940_29415 [Polyangiaceae bacterium]|nr:hypothetical protein [Polyangiaceae bacterium]
MTAVTENASDSGIDSRAAPPTLTLDLCLMPRLGVVLGASVLIVGVGVGIAGGPGRLRVMASVIVLVTVALLGAVLVYLLRLHCRLEVASPYRTVRWSIRKQQQQLALDHILRVMTLVDEMSDEPAYHVAFELKSGSRIRLSGYSWGERHAEQLARQVRDFLEYVARTAATR